MGGTPDFTVGDSAGTPDASVDDTTLLTEPEGDARYVRKPIEIELAQFLPWHIELLPIGTTPVANTNWPGTYVQDTQCAYGGTMNSASNQNDEVSFDVVLAAGTWTFQLLHLANTDAGIYTVQLDGVTVGTIDGYVASITKNVISVVSGISVATTGKKRLKLKMATKNGSSSSYKGRIQKIEFQRTA